MKSEKMASRYIQQGSTPSNSPFSYRHLNRQASPNGQGIFQGKNPMINSPTMFRNSGGKSSRSKDVIKELFGVERFREIDVCEEITAFATTQTEKALTQLDKKMQTICAGTDIGDLRPLNAISTQIAGKHIFEMTVALLSECEILLLKAVLANADLQSWMEHYNAELQARMEELDDLQNQNDKPVKPMDEYYYVSNGEKEYDEKSILLLYLHVKRWYGIQHENLPTAPKDWTITDVIEANPFNNTVKKQTAVAHYLEEFKQAADYLQDYTLEQEQMKGMIKSKKRDEYLHDQTKYYEDTKAYQEMEKEVKRLQKRYQTMGLVGQLNLAFTTAIATIVGKIKSAVRSYPEIVSKLRQTAILTTTEHDTHITNPFDNNSLIGMIQILKNEYVKLNIVTFQGRLIDLLNSKLPKQQMKDPEFGIEQIEFKMHNWETQDMDELFTRDLFWTVCFLRQYDADNEIYMKSLEHIVEFIHKQQHNGHLNPSPVSAGSLLYPERPILSDLISWLKSVYKVTRPENPTQNTSTGGQYNGGGYKKYNNNNNQSSNNQNMPNQKQNGGKGSSHIKSSEGWAFQATEMAYVAPVNSKTCGNMKKIEQKFTKCVTRDELYGIMDSKGNQLLYTATTEACKQCSSENREHPRPMCYLKKCEACGLFGHKKRDCQQQM